MIGWTLCSGIGAPEIAAPWVDWRLASEIENFPRAVLQDRFGYRLPEDHNQGEPLLWSDMTQVTPGLARSKGVPLPDLLVAGTPCQDFSIAGLRAGTDGDRGNLTLQFLISVMDIADAARDQGREPPFVLWENVPGIFSISGNPLEKLISGFNMLGYACDLSILDAQYFGVPQRRRRVFLACQNVESGRKKKSVFFGTAGATFLTDTLLTVLADHLDQSGKSVKDWGFAARHCADGQKKRMKLFGLSADHLSQEIDRNHLLNLWLKDWAETIQSFPKELPPLGLTYADSVRQADMLGARCLDGAEALKAESPSTNTLALWSATLDAVCAEESISTTSTETKTTTDLEIYLCAEMLLSIAQFITNSTGLPLNYLDEASSTLTALKGFTRYARETSNDLFGDRERVCEWRDYEQRAQRQVSIIERHFARNACPAAVLFERQGLRGNTPPRRETREGVAGRIAKSLAIRGRDGTPQVEVGDEVANAILTPNGGRGGIGCGAVLTSTGDVSHCLNAGGMGRIDYETETMIAHALRGEGFDASEDGTGRGTPIVPIAFQSVDQGADASHDLSPTLRRHDPMAVATGWAVRRLTPVECARLQGFPDDHCAITYRGKPAADGPKYKALGNSMAVPVIAWLMDRMKISMEAAQ